MGLHCINNFGASIISLLSDKAGNTETAINTLQTISPKRLLGSAMVLFFAGPLLAALGLQLFKPKLAKDAPLEERRERQKKCQNELIIATLISCSILIVGIILIITDPKFKEAMEQSRQIVNPNS